jgi:hypothetical protein
MFAKKKSGRRVFGEVGCRAARRGVAVFMPGLPWLRAR